MAETKRVSMKKLETKRKRERSGRKSDPDPDLDEVEIVAHAIKSGESREGGREFLYGELYKVILRTGLVCKCPSGRLLLDDYYSSMAVTGTGDVIYILGGLEYLEVDKGWQHIPHYQSVYNSRRRSYETLLPLKPTGTFCLASGLEIDKNSNPNVTLLKFVKFRVERTPSPSREALFTFISFNTYAMDSLCYVTSFVHTDFNKLVFERQDRLIKSLWMFRAHYWVNYTTPVKENEVMFTRLIIHLDAIDQ